jgi:hypothetical protein
MITTTMTMITKMLFERMFCVSHALPICSMDTCQPSCLKNKYILKWRMDMLLLLPNDQIEVVRVFTYGDSNGGTGNEDTEYVATLMTSSQGAHLVPQYIMCCVGEK